MIAENWVHTDESEDVAGSIRHVLRVASFVDQDAQTWKWAALALHSALQGACVCHLTTSASPVGAVTERNAGEWLSFFEEHRSNPNARPPKTYLMALPDLLKAVRKPHSAGDRSNATGVAIDTAELKWLVRFHNEVRNQFVHFEPMGWSLEVSGIPQIGIIVARVIGDILEMGYAFRHQDSQRREKLRRDLQELASCQWCGEAKKSGCLAFFSSRLLPYTPIGRDKAAQEVASPPNRQRRCSAQGHGPR